MTESFTDLDLLEELQQFHSPTPIRKKGEGITAQEYAIILLEEDGIDLTDRQCHKRLKKMVKLQGWKEEKMVDFDGRKRNVYYRNEKE
jgi:hypothetical protein